MKMNLINLFNKIKYRLLCIFLWYSFYIIDKINTSLIKLENRFKKYLYDIDGDNNIFDIIKDYYKKGFEGFIRLNREKKNKEFIFYKREKDTKSLFFSKNYELDHIKKERDEFSKDIIQPYINNGKNINKDFIKVYGDSFFRKERRMSSQQIKKLSDY